ncbi:response regulator [Coraliomargarita sp. W4R53]
MIDLLIVEDNTAYLNTLKEMIQLTDDMQCLDAWCTAESAIAGIQEGDFPPETILLLDLHLPGSSGLSLVPSFQKAYPEGNIIIITQEDNECLVLEAIQIGVVGYLLKNSPIGQIREAIRDIHAGGSIIDPKMSRYIIQALSGNLSNDSNILSPREVQVLELMAIGKVKKEVAHELGLSYHAVALYTRNIYQKLKVPNITAAVAKAIRRRLI